MELKILELFSGIGGMHQAFKYTTFKGEVIAAVDINPVANTVYKHNHPNTPIWNKNIEKIEAEKINQLNVNMLLLSPPCQPHTRVGNQRDIQDPRSDALNHITELLPKCLTVQYIIMENVKGFETSQAHDNYIQKLEEAGFHWREFIISPHQLGVPNTRHRYYCLARKHLDFAFQNNKLWTQLPFSVNTVLSPTKVEDILENITEVNSDFSVPIKVLEKYGFVMDIVTSQSNNTNCFTKAYTRYHEGTGSVYASHSNADVHKKFDALKSINAGIEEKIQILQQLEIRFFTPREVARLMSFPDSFEFPASVTNRQCYRLLGNSINVKVVGELINLVCS